MQNDLISRSALIEHIKEFTNINDGYFENPHLLVRVIENQPTAYNVEKVVAELKEKADTTLKQAEKGNGILHKNIIKDWRGRASGLISAIEIVRKGGKE